MEHLFRSESYRAAWVFFATPVDRARLIGHVGHSVMIFFLLPYLAMLAAVFVWAFGDLWHAVLHTGVLGLISHLGIQARLLVAPRVPFSQPVKKGARVGAFMGVVLIGWVGRGAAAPHILDLRATGLDRRRNHGPSGRGNGGAAHRDAPDPQPCAEVGIHRMTLDASCTCPHHGAVSLARSVGVAHRGIIFRFLEDG